MTTPVSASEHAAKADTTPMIDAVFLLIVFFLCLDFRTLESKLAAYLPRDSGGGVDMPLPVEPLTVAVIVDDWGTAVPRLSGREQPFALVGHRIHWRLGAKRFAELRDLVDQLARLARDPHQRVPDLAIPGRSKQRPVVIEPWPGATYGDVATTVDAVRQAGFDEIQFGGGRGARQR